MSLYFFDTFENGRHFQDDVGLPCRSIAEARRKAMQALPAIAMEEIPKSSGEQTFTMLVRDQKGQTVYSATLRFDGPDEDGTGEEDAANNVVQLFN